MRPPISTSLASREKPRTGGVSESSAREERLAARRIGKPGLIKHRGPTYGGAPLNDATKTTLAWRSLTLGRTARLRSQPSRQGSRRRLLT